MRGIFLTKSKTPIIGWIAIPLGALMGLIFRGINAIGLPYVALAIVIFTIVINLLMTPLVVRQQRSSRMQMLVQPEIKKIQQKYKGRRDTASQQKMMEETQAVYAKYGVSMSGSCVQLLIQMPILFAVYQVIYRIPGYISLIGNEIKGLVTANGFSEFFQNFVANAGNSTLTSTLTANPTTETMIDTVYKLNTSQWTSLLDSAAGQSFASKLTDTFTYLKRTLNFLTLNISDSPMQIIQSAWKDKSFLLILLAIAFPVLAWFTQWLAAKMMPQPKADPTDTTANSMKTMNLVMPLMSAVFCLTLPVGVGIYWIAGAVIRALQSLAINKVLAKEDLDELIEKNKEKAAKRRNKKGASAQSIARNTTVNTRSMPTASERQKDFERRIREADEKAASKARPADGSIASKVNLVSDYNAKHGQNRKHLDAKKK